MTEVSIENLKVLTVDEAVEITGQDESREYMTKSGVYKITSGSRGYFDGCEYVGDLDMKTLSLMTVEQCVESLIGQDYNEEELEETTMYVEEFYGFEVDKDYVQFGYTEEEFDWFVKVTV